MLPLTIKNICIVICTLLISKFQNFSQNTLIPRALDQRIEKGSLQIPRKINIKTNSKVLEFEASYLRSYFQIFSQNNNSKSFVSDISLEVRLSIKSKFNPKSKESYALNIGANGIGIVGNHPTGIFRGINSLIQLLGEAQANGKDLQFLRINDAPKFSWRGMHLDVCRHFYAVDFIKKYIDLLALYKMNVFHWHLTEDQGWRIEIKKYPKLTEIGSWRNGTMIGPYDNQEYDTIRYGGFYTQEQIKEIVNYAAQRHITVVPEIELPGHALAALASYPEFSCTGGPFEVAKGWGVFDDVYCAKPETFQFLEDVLSEVLELFPSTYIHIGGDECPKVRWKTCPNCQKTIQENHLKDEHELQSYFIRRMENFLNSRGRKLIGWDEILEGGLAPDAAVMSWRGTDGGIAAAKMKHEVVMTPGSHCYFDHYQGDSRQEPLAFGGFTSLEKVYSFNPIPDDLTKKESKFILGAQGNVWTEYMSGTARLTGSNFSKELNFWKDDMTPEQHVEYMVLPRLLALAEVTWGTSEPQQYSEFLTRVIQHQKNILSLLNYNFSRSIYDIVLHVFAKEGMLFAELVSPLVKQLFFGTEEVRGEIYMEGFSSSLYKAPIPITRSIDLTYYHNFDGYYTESSTVPYSMRRMTYNQLFNVNKATAKTITLLYPPHENYSFGGAFALVNGIQSPKQTLTKDWLGFSGKDLVATIDLMHETQIKTLGINVMERKGSWIYYPQTIYFECSSDGKEFFKVAQVDGADIVSCQGKIRLTLSQPVQGKFLRVRAVNHGIIEDGNPGAGHAAWLFADEILVD